MRSCLFSLIVALSLVVPACKDRAPPIDPDIAAAMNDDAGIGTPKNNLHSTTPGDQVGQFAQMIMPADQGGAAYMPRFNFNLGLMR